MKTIVVIPARMESQRFPGKPLYKLSGKPMIEWVVQAISGLDFVDETVVATPNKEIADFVTQIGARAILTRKDHPSGTDRTAEVAEIVEADIYVNVQGDQPLIEPDTVFRIAKPMLEDPKLQLVSAYTVCSQEDYENPSSVKVVTDLKGNALYFSRSKIPFVKNNQGVPIKKHVGVYAYRRELLLKFPTWRVGELEKMENLEQLRYLENGSQMYMVEVPGSDFSVNTPEDIDLVERILDSRAMVLS